MRIKLICLLAVLAVLVTAVPQMRIFASAPQETAQVSETDVVSAADAEYFERIAVVPVNTEIPEFYKQVTNIAGMYIFTMPDGTVHKRIYGSLGGVYGWYVPEGPSNTVPVSAKPIDTQEDIDMYNEAMAEQEENKDGEEQDYVGILPPESGVSGVTVVFGQPISKLIKISGIAAASLCIIILIGSAVMKNRRR